MMRLLLVIYSTLFLTNYTLFSQNKLVFKPSFQWLTLEQAEALHPDSVLYLSLEKTKIASNRLPVEIFKYKNLKALSLRGLKMTELEDSLTPFSQLIFLDISKNKFTVFPVAICSLQNLETIVAHKNPFDYLPYQIGQLENLKHLDLWETPVTDLPSSMESIETLVYIDLQGVNINNERQEMLKKRFPNLKFELDPPCNCFH